MNCKKTLLPATAALLGAIALHVPAQAATSVLIGDSGKTYASGAVQCATRPDTGALAAVVEAGLFNPKRGVSATVSLNGAPVASVTTANPVADVWLADGANTVVVALSKRLADSYAFTVTAGMCDLPDTSGNTFSADGTLEFAASGKSYATVVPGCALNGATGQTQPYVNLFDNGGYLLNVSVNGVPLTQLSATRPHTPVFLSAGANVISAANGSLSTDYYVRDGGTGTCAL
jgi:streptogramin lyase